MINLPEHPWDTAEVFIPASPVNRENLVSGIKTAEDLGIQFIHPTTTLSTSHLISKVGSMPYLAATDHIQSQLFSKLVNSRSHIIWCARGGYGSLRWLDLIDWTIFETDKTIPVFIGFSDCTFLFSAMLKRGARVLHAPLLTTLPDTSQEATAALKNFLSAGILCDIEGTTLTQGKATGTLIGGNLTCLCHLIGTRHEPRWEGAILLIEDHHEALYRIDRMLTHLLMSGRLNTVKGIVIGHLSDTAADTATVNLLLKDRLEKLDIPIATNIPAGHKKENYPLLMGAQYKLVAHSRKAILSMC